MFQGIPQPTNWLIDQPHFDRCKLFSGLKQPEYQCIVFKQPTLGFHGDSQTNQPVNQMTDRLSDQDVHHKG